MKITSSRALMLYVGFYIRQESYSCHNYNKICIIRLKLKKRQFFNLQKVSNSRLNGNMKVKKTLNIFRV
jgi:hypothetical protein